MSDMSRTVRVDEETYRKLTVHAGKLQRDSGSPIHQVIIHDKIQ